MADFVAEDAKGAEDDEVAAMFDLKLKKKKKKKKSETEVGEGNGAESGGGGLGEGGEIEGSSGASCSHSAPSSSGSALELDPPIYTYGQMLNRVVDFLHQNNPEMLEKRKYTMKPPQLMRGKYLFIMLRIRYLLSISLTVPHSHSTYVMVKQLVPRRPCGRTFRRYAP